MASKEFMFRILTPGAELFSGMVTDVVIPAHDGEAGVLPLHKDMISLLGTGVLKLVKDGDDYWFVVSSGIFEVRGGEVTVLAEMGEPADVVDIEAAKAEEKRLEPMFAEKNSFAEDFEEFKVAYERAKARIEIHRRTHSVH